MTNSTAYKIGGSTGTVSAGEGQPVRMVKVELDIANVAATVTTGGVATIMTLPIDTYFKFIRAELVTAVSLDSSTSGRIDIGDATDDDQFVSNATTFTAGTDLTVITENGEDGPVYLAANALNIKLTGDKMAGGTANATGKVRFVFLIGDASRLAFATNQAT